MYSREELEAAGLTDFRVFLKLMWKHLGLPPPTRVQLNIAYTLQHGKKRLMIQAFRGVGKSWITAAFVLWTLLLDPQKKILVVSASQPLADNFSIFCKAVVNGWDLLAHLRPGPNQRSSNLAWDVGPATADPAPSVKSAGLTGQITGSRADIIVFDDVEVPKNSYTHALRERLATLITEADAILKPLPESRIIYLGTPQNEQSVYRKLPERGYMVRIWPAEVPEDISRYNGNLAPYVVKMVQDGVPKGTPVDPMRFDKDDLFERRLSYGRAGYALQFMLDTSPSDIDAHPLKLRDLIIWECDRDMAPAKLAWGGSKELIVSDLQAGGFDGDYYHRPAFISHDAFAPYTGTVMAIDPSGRGADETAYAIVRILNGQLFLVASGGFQDGFSEETLKGLAMVAAAHGNNYVITEENFGGGMFAQLLKPWLAKYGGGSLDEDYKVWSRGQKEARIIEVLQPVLEQHRLIVDRKVIELDLIQQANNEAYSLVWQMTRLKKEKGALPHDDRIEAVAMAVGYWTDKMARDADLALQEHKEDAQAKELQDWMDGIWLQSVLGKPTDRDAVGYWHKRN